MAGATLTMGNALPRFFRWWLSELASCLPEGMRKGIGRTRRFVLVSFEGDEVTFSYRSGSDVRELGRILVEGPDPTPLPGRVRRSIRPARRRDVEVVLQMPHGEFLERKIELPAAAAENLREVLGYEMDRHTPLRAEDVYFDYRVVGSDSAQKTIDVDLVIIPRHRIDRALHLLEGWGLSVDRAGITGQDPRAPAAFNLLTKPAVPQDRWTRGLVILLVIAAAALLFAAIVLPLQQKKALLASIEAELAEAQAEAADVQLLRQEVEALTTSSRFVLERKLETPTVTETLDEITRVLPDDTWVVMLDWGEESVSLSGYSANASALIGILEQSAMLSEARFVSPVTFDPRVGADRFHISFRVQARGES